MTAHCDYDDALPGFAGLVAARLGTDALRQHLFLRDSTGRLTLVLRGERPRERYGAEALDSLVQAAHSALSPYVDEIVVATPAELFDASLDDPDVGFWERLPDHTVRVVERWLVGQDWQTPPQPGVEGAPPVMVFASHKGGVGRSTALVVAAADLANRGHNVLALDLDLEAPGLGAMLLPDDRRPTYGAVDFFVENGLRSLGDAFFAELYGISALTRGRGLVHVVPAVGRRSLEHPQNLLGKLARAYLEDPAPGGVKSFLSQTRDLIAGMSERHTYDVVLVDTRAGLHESTAAAILGLGGDVLLFGVDTPQTFEGYKFLLAHLTRFIGAGVSDDWRWRIRLVHAKAVADPRRWRTFNDRAYELFQAHLYDQDELNNDGSDRSTFTFSLDDPEAPHVAWRILSDSNFAEFDPPTRPDQLEAPVYARTFGPFVDALRERVFAEHGT